MILAVNTILVFKLIPLRNVIEPYDLPHVVYILFLTQPIFFKTGKQPVMTEYERASYGDGQNKVESASPLLKTSYIFNPGLT